MSAEHAVEMVRAYAQERIIEAGRAVEDGDPLSARFMWGSIVREEMQAILELLNEADR
jgi:hypothetical protein